MLNTTANRVPASYRDPSGFIFRKDNQFFRQVNNFRAHDYEMLMNTGLYDKLVQKKWLVPHTEVGQDATLLPEEPYKTLLPEQLSFISYPYEWSFQQLREAALLTLNIALLSLEHNMLLKDATPYNVSFHQGKPYFIDTLSFEKYEEGKPWVAYKQFCETFLAPLCLMHYFKPDANAWMLKYIDGIPLDMVAKILPFRSKLKLQLYLHVHLHGKHYTKADSGGKKKEYFVNKRSLTGLLQGLKQAVKGLSINQKSYSAWKNYYAQDILSTEYLAEKKAIIVQLTAGINTPKVLDLGANNGYFSRLFAEKGCNVVASDIDPFCINDLYLQIRKEKIKNIHPLIVDLANPVPGIGFENEERSSFLDRANADLALALALIHHLAIGRNLPFEKIAGCFAKITNYLLIEFVPKTDPKVAILLANREDIFFQYTEEHFVAAFSQHFDILKAADIPSSERRLYLMIKK